jgi:protein SCO1/2
MKAMTHLRRHVVFWLALMIFFPLLAHANGKGQWVRKASSGPAPAFSLTDQDNRKFALDDLRGKVVLLSFIYTQCASGCPITTAKLASIYDELKGRKDLHIVGVTIDPEHDTPAVLKDYGRQFKGVDFRTWSFLTGPQREVNDILLDYKVSPQWHGKRGPTGEVVSVSIVDHVLKTYLIDRKGAKRVEYWGQDFDPKVVLKDLKKVLDEDRNGP